MSAAAHRSVPSPRTRAPFNYLVPSVESSLRRNGRVLMQRDRDGNDSGAQGVVVEKRELDVIDARSLSGDLVPTLERNGFESARRPFASSDFDFVDHERVLRDYYPDCERAVREATGASDVFAFDHNVRSARGKRSGARIEGGQHVQPPAHIVHGDYTLTGAPQRLRDLAEPPSSNDTLRSILSDGESLLSAERVERVIEDGKRFAIINVWRNIASEPVATHPLAFCDAQTVAPEDLVVFEIHYSDRVGENYFAKHADRHRWYYYPELERDEVVLIKQWDSAGPLARTGGASADASDDRAPGTFSFHSAFKDPKTPEDAPDRWSIEVRCIALYDGADG